MDIGKDVSEEGEARTGLVYMEIRHDVREEKGHSFNCIYGNTVTRRRKVKTIHMENTAT